MSKFTLKKKMNEFYFTEKIKIWINLHNSPILGPMKSLAMLGFIWFIRLRVGMPSAPRDPPEPAPADACPPPGPDDPPPGPDVGPARGCLGCSTGNTLRLFFGNLARACRSIQFDSFKMRIWVNWILKILRNYRKVNEI